RPPKELKGFQKVAVKTGAKASVGVTISKKYATSYWDEERDQWISEAGEYDVLVGQSSADVVVAGHFTIVKTNWWKGL
ncbi:hypothetical protein MCOR31_008275, partial [Pyricularia oryzae]